MKRSNIIKTTLSAACLAAMLVIPCSSNAITYYLNLGNSAISGYPLDYGKVTVNLVDSTHASITFQALDSGGYHYLFGDGGSVGVNVNGTFTASNIAWSGQPQSPNDTPAFTPTSGNQDGWGSFNFVLDDFDGFTHAVRTVSFDLENTSGTWSSDANVLVANGSPTGYFVEAHIFVANSAYGNINVTGYASSNGGTSPTPPPIPDGGSTVALLGFAIIALGGVRRLFR